jgi:hypothetical protein
MEASDNVSLPLEGGGSSDLQRIDLDHVRRMLREGAAAAGFERLGLMVGTILPRLTADAQSPRRD